MPTSQQSMSRISWPDLTQQPKSNRRTAIVTREAVAIGNSHVVRAREPRTAPKLALRAVAIDPGGTAARCSLIVIRPAIIHPLKNVAQGVIQAKGVRNERAHRGGLRVAVHTRLHHPAGVALRCRLVGHIRVAAGCVRVSPGTCGCRTCACRVLPLRSARQT